MTRLAVLSAGPLGRIRGSGRAFPRARGLGVHALVAEAGQLPQEQLEVESARLAAALRPALAPAGEAAFAALCTPQLLSDSALAALGAALEAEGIGLGLSVTRFALADRLARGDREEATRTLLLDASGDGVALFAAPDDATAVAENLAETCEQRRGAVLRTFRQVAKVDLSTTTEGLDAWLEAVQSSGELETAANATWYLPDGTRVAVPSDALEQALDAVQSSWIAAVVEGCVDKAAEDVDCLVVAGWLDDLFHLGPRLRAALPHVRVLVLDHEREAQMIQTWTDARERPRAGRVWVVDRDFAAAPAQLAWSTGGAPAPVPAEEPAPAPPAALAPEPEPASPAEASDDAPAAPAPRRTDRGRRARPSAAAAPSAAPAGTSGALVAVVAVLALAQVGTIWWFARSGRVRAAEGTTGRNGFSADEVGALDPVEELRADVAELRGALDSDSRDTTSYRFRLEELEAELTKLRYALDEKPAAEDLEAVREEAAEARRVAVEAASGEERQRLARTVSQLALDVQDLQQAEMALAQLTRDIEDLRSSGALTPAAASDSPAGAVGADAGRVDALGEALTALDQTVQRLDDEGDDARERLEFLEATFEELDVESSLATLTSSSHLLMERVARNEEALSARAEAGGADVTGDVAALLLDRCETIEQTLRNLRGDVERIRAEGAPGELGAGPVATASDGLVERISANEEAITAVREALAAVAPLAAGEELAPATLYPELAARRMRLFNAEGQRVVHASYDEDGHGALRLYGSDGSRHVLAGSAQGGEAGFLGTFDSAGHELFKVSTNTTNGAAHLSLMDSAGDPRVNMTTNSSGDGVLWIQDRRGRSVEVLGGGGDLAETVRPAPGATLLPGQVVRVVGVDAHGPLVAPSVDEYDTAVLGIVSSAGDLEPAVTFGRTGAPGEQAVALAGQVYCLVDADAAPIRAGDVLVSAGRAGHARRADPDCAPPGSIVGKALEDLAAGTGLIRVWVQAR